jgi:hypothetical protein
MKLTKKQTLEAGGTYLTRDQRRALKHDAGIGKGKATPKDARKGSQRRTDS